MDFVAIEFPALRVAIGDLGQAQKLIRVGLAIRASGQILEILTNELIDAGPQSLRATAGFGDDLIIDGQCEVHVHRLRVHGDAIKVQGGPGQSQIW